MTPRISVVIPACNEGETIVPCLDRIFAPLTLPCEVLVVYDDPADTTVPYLEKFALDEPRLLPSLNEYGLEELTKLVERGVVVAAASRYMSGGQQIGGPIVKTSMSRLAGLSLYWLARVGTRDATNSFKAYSTDFVRQVGVESDAGFEIGIELVAKARRLRLSVAELPTIWLERGGGQSNFKMLRWLPRYLRWYRFAFGPRLTPTQLAEKKRASPP